MLKGMKNKTFLFIPLLVFLGNSLLFSQEESVSVRDAALATGLAWIISPMDGQNNILRYAGGGGVHIQYGKGIGHDTKEVFYTFTLDLETSFSSNYYKADFSIDGFFWSHGLYFEESEGTFGVNLMYEGEWASNAVFSNAGLGIKYLYEKNFLDSGVRFTFFAQADNIFMGTRSLYSLYKRRSDFSDSSNPPRFYNFGYGALAKTGFSLGNSFWGTLYGEVSADFLLPFLGSEVKGARCKRNFMVEAKAGSLGISDNFTYKADRYRSEPDTVQVFNSFDVYAKVWFIR